MQFSEVRKLSKVHRAEKPEPTDRHNGLENGAITFGYAERLLGLRNWLPTKFEMRSTRRCEWDSAAREITKHGENHYRSRGEVVRVISGSNQSSP
ncbi:Uncharacterised protein [Vibrio cholerae]|uniref:Uncharacterized protein n=1 Tax=Vibrio cholerae TaxID=666 RepID=A0A655V2H1_VIBCL|nr:Uncharacterised protein [Vibrio cholerae]